jgi:hypothetical protein
MARCLTFSINGSEYAASPVKADRKKLYGWTETIALDDEGRECKMVSMDETGTLVIPRGGAGLGILSPDDRWVDRSSLKAVSADGRDAELIKSSYDGPIVLDRIAGADEVLDHCITGMYQFTDAPPELIRAVGDAVYSFTYSYRDSYEGSRAFLLAAEGTLFMLIGYDAEFEMLSLSEAGVIDEAEEEEDENESGDIDFSMGL